MMTRATAKQMMKDVETALQSVALKYNMSVKTNGSTYDDLSLKPRIEFIGVDAAGNSKIKVDFERHAEMFNLKPEWLGKTVIVNGLDAKIVELSTRSRKWPVIVEVANGDKYKMDPRSVRAQLNK